MSADAAARPAAGSFREHHCRGHLPAVLLLAVLAGALLLLRAGPAAAHTELTTSRPAAGGVVPATTSQVVLTFSGRVSGAFSTVAVTGPDGVDVARGPVSVDGGRVVQAVEGPLTAGSWQLTYRVVAADGHAVTGSVPFSVAAGPATPDPPVPSAARPASPAAVPPDRPGGGADASSRADQGSASRVLGPLAALGLAAAGAAVVLGRSRRR